ncbi:MAG: hypothetical protein K8R59_05455 [Thermoanaerobaculales bacterium]|nr:hypothetical protein [Thermoanaerobaculales bacterium]
MERTIVVIAAHAFEARAVAGVGRGMTKEPWGRWMLYRGEMWDQPLAVIRCGPGKVSAAAAAQAAVQYLEPALLLSFGVAGCADSAVKVGTMVIARTVVDVALSQLEDLPVEIPSRFESSVGLLRCFNEVPGPVEGVVLCWEGHQASPETMPPGMPFREGPVAVDWESSAVAEVAEMWDVPWAVLKLISDHGEKDRLRRVAVIAKRPLQWSAEVLRRACTAFLGAEEAAGEDVAAKTPLVKESAR